MVNHPNRSRRNPNPTPSPAREAIRAARDAAKMTQSEAARVVHVTLNAWQKWEHNTRKMHPAIWELFLSKTGQRGEPDAET